jgi:hypothetical protein
MDKRSKVANPLSKFAIVRVFGLRLCRAFHTPPRYSPTLSRPPSVPRSVRRVARRAPANDHAIERLLQRRLRVDQADKPVFVQTFVAAFAVQGLTAARFVVRAAAGCRQHEPVVGYMATKVSSDGDNSSGAVRLRRHHHVVRTSFADFSLTPSSGVRELLSRAQRSSHRAPKESSVSSPLASHAKAGRYVDAPSRRRDTCERPWGP